MEFLCIYKKVATFSPMKKSFKKKTCFMNFFYPYRSLNIFKTPHTRKNFSKKHHVLDVFFLLCQVTQRVANSCNSYITHDVLYT